ncbi:hypothetical protein [Natronosalvus caseinilyticus]|uniref:hypothetical protein n=1 Tax=Natronosalvus caseinilyticus TaxID=2953747 RepID=UPI0028A8A52C|nr:hypothetical protein [Natronosalvus caseinilyticus]
MKRRYFIGTATGVLAGGVTGASQSAMAVARSSSATRTDNVLSENGHVRYEADAGRFVYKFEYDIPETIAELTIEIGELEWGEASVRETRGVSRKDTTSFLWDGETTPRLIIETRPDGVTLPDGVPGTYAVGDAAFEPRLRPSLPFRYSGEEPRQRLTLSIVGAGFVGDGFVYAGPAETYTRSAAGTKMTIVVPESVEKSVPHEELLDTYAFAESAIVPRIPRDRMAVCVVPRSWGGPGGYAIRNDVVMHDTVARITDIESVATHEYVHTLFGVFGGRDMYWLKEAIAEYYGYLVALNVGAETFDAFLETVTTDRSRDAVLADAELVQRTMADYDKGAHVLAALDAEIQRVSDGAATLNDVFTTGEFDLSTFAGFEAAVGEASGSSSLSQWLERYVRSESLPEIPPDPQYFVLGDRTPDSLQPTPPATSDSIGPWQTDVENDASVEGNETALTIRVHQCSSGSVTQAINDERVAISFDYEIEAEGWWERPYVEVLEDGAPVWTGSVGRSDLYDEQVFEISAGGTTRGHVQKTVSGTGPLEVRLGIVPSEACSAGDHGTTWLRVLNFEIHSRSPDEPDDNASVDPEGSASVDTEDDVSTDTEDETSNGETNNDDMPGFGIGSAFGVLGGVSYLLKQRLSDNETSSK